MKRNLLLICFSIYCTIAHSQPKYLVDAWGTWGIGNIKNASSLDVFEGYNIKGYHIYVDWADLEPVRGVFDWITLDKELQIVADKDLWIGLQLMVGPNCPEWIYDSVPKVFTTGGNDDGPYPYYLDPGYKKHYFNVMKQLANHLSNLPDNLKLHFMYWQISEGSTGDEQPYKGTPTDSIYNIDYYVWQDFRHEAWDSAGAYRPDKNNAYRYLFNSGNFAQDLQYVDAHFHGDLHKDGLLSHWYSFDGERLYYVRQYKELNEANYDNRTRGEVQDNFNTTWWMLAPVKQAFTLACSAVSGGLDMMNIGGGYVNATLDTRPTNFFEKYCGMRKVDIADKGFIALRDVPDFADTARFSPAIYGPVVHPSQQKAFDKRIQAIEDNPQDSSMHKYWLKMRTVVLYMNPERVQKITAEFAPFGAMHNENGDDYHDDFGINMTDNFTKFIRQIQPNSTSIGAWRIGEDSSMYGRYARLFKINNNRGEMYFKFNKGLIHPGERVEFTVTYYDTANGQWSLNGSSRHIETQNRNRNRWMQGTIGIDNFVEGTLLDGLADFSLRYEGGANTPFTLIEVKVIPAAKQTQKQPIAENINLKLSPNPNKGQFTVELTSKASETYTVVVTNVNGNVIFSEKKIATVGLNTWNFSSPKLKEGMYVLHVESLKAKGSANFVVNK